MVYIRYRITQYTTVYIYISYSIEIYITCMLISCTVDHSPGDEFKGVLHCLAPVGLLGKVIGEEVGHTGLLTLPVKPWRYKDVDDLKLLDAHNMLITC